MKRGTLLTTAAALGLAFGLATLVPAQAETYQAATWNATGSPNDKFLTDFATQVREATGGDIDFEIYPGGTLLPADSTLPGLEAGVAQIANITAAYIPSDMPVNNVIADLSFVADNQLALAFAATEMNFFNPQLQAELKDKDVVFATGFTIGIYNFICGGQINTIEDLKGKKIRTSSSAQIDFVKDVGGVPVSVAGPEIYTGIQRGSLDCTAGTPLFLTDFFKLTEVAKSVYQLPLGSNANGGYYFNKSFWQDRTPEERRILLKALSRATAKSMIDWSANIDKAWQASRDAGVALVKPEQAAKDKLAAFTKDFLSRLPKEAMEKRKIDDPTELINQTVAALEKWSKLLSEVDTTDLDAVTALLDREVFDKVDVETYGVD